MLMGGIQVLFYLGLLGCSAVCAVVGAVGVGLLEDLQQLL